MLANKSDFQEESSLKMSIFFTILFGILTVCKNSILQTSEEEKLEMETKYERYKEMSQLKKLQPNMCNSCNVPKVFRSAHCQPCLGRAASKMQAQDDIVYPELTVRENLLYAARFQLPPGTTDGEIEDLADSTMASLGLSRVADSLVGDSTRRGVSGGEKKRVNIGVELMKKPRILFLDEVST